MKQNIYNEKTDMILLRFLLLSQKTNEFYKFMRVSFKFTQHDLSWIC